MKKVMTFRESSLNFGKVRGIDGNKINEKEQLDEVGAFVNCGSGHGDTICLLNKIQIEDIGKAGEVNEVNTVELSVVGHIKDGVFSRGIDRLPRINCNCYLLNDEQTNSILGLNENEEESKKYFKVSEDGFNEVHFNIDKLFGRHFAVLGTTGSGKSCTVASIMQAVLNSYKQPRILFFDTHNEYPNAFGHGTDEHADYKSKTNCIQWKDFSLPYWFMDLDEFIGVYYPSAGPNQEAEIKKIIVELKQKYVETEFKERVSVDTPTFFDIDELINVFNQEILKASTLPKKEPWEKFKLKFESINQDTRYGFLKKDKKNQLSLEEYFIKLLGLAEAEPKYLNILDLSGLPSEVRNVCVGVLSRLCFDYAYWDLDPEDLPFALVLEEAHSYIPDDTSSEFDLSRKQIERIAKEGRKYGISLVVVSQRPSNISTTVLSQCGSFITLRLTSDIDQNKVKRLLPDTLESQANILPSLRDGEALVTGDAIKLPRKVYFKIPSPMPKSNDVRYHKSWSEGVPPAYDLKGIIKSWKLREKITQNENTEN